MTLGGPRDSSERARVRAATTSLHGRSPTAVGSHPPRVLAKAPSLQADPPAEQVPQDNAIIIIPVRFDATCHKDHGEPSANTQPFFPTPASARHFRLRCGRAGGAVQHNLPAMGTRMADTTSLLTLKPAHHLIRRMIPQFGTTPREASAGHNQSTAPHHTHAHTHRKTSDPSGLSADQQRRKTAAGHHRSRSPWIMTKRPNALSVDLNASSQRERGGEGRAGQKTTTPSRGRTERPQPPLPIP